MRLIVLLLFLMVGCVTTQEATTPAASSHAPAAPPLAARPLPQAPRDCPPPDVTCSSEYDPVACTAQKANGATLSSDDRPMGWGSNPCNAHMALQRDACRRNLSPGALTAIACVPDTSVGACPPPPAICAADYAPAVCTASRYEDQELGQKQALRAEGSNTCRARATLLVKACRQNLNPRGLQNIHCVLLSQP